MLGRLLQRRRDQRDVDYSSLWVDPIVLPNAPLPDERDQLIEAQRESIAVLNDVLAQQSAVVVAARHLMHVLALSNAAGPVFKLNDENDDASVEVIRHAVLDLQALLEGTNPPPLVIPERMH